jgi:N-acetylmuramoyl-L-alanine amidase
VFFVIKAKKVVLAAIIVLIIILLAAIIVPCIKTKEEPESPASAFLDRPVLVIDAGHGGEDGGAQTASGVLESALNLDIALKLDSMSGLFGVPTVLTRKSENIEYPEDADRVRERKQSDQKARIELINSIPNAVLVSIHQNKFPQASPRGSQVLYAETGGSKEFGELTHLNLISALYPQNRRVASPIPDTILLMRSVKCTAILVECGFLSNPEEAALLETPEYRTKVALVLLCSYLQYTN